MKTNDACRPRGRRCWSAATTSSPPKHAQRSTTRTVRSKIKKIADKSTRETFAGLCSRRHQPVAASADRQADELADADRPERERRRSHESRSGAALIGVALALYSTAVASAQLSGMLDQVVMEFAMRATAGSRW